MKRSPTAVSSLWRSRNTIDKRFESDFRDAYPKLRRFAFSLTTQAADAEDLIQRASERAMKKYGQFKQGTSFNNWIFQLTRNLWIDTVRARGRRAKREVSEEAGLSVGYDPHPATHAAIDLKTALSAMDKLPEEQREIVALILIEGMGYREVSEMLDLPIGTVSSRLVRGRKALLVLLGEGQDD